MSMFGATGTVVVPFAGGSPHGAAHDTITERVSLGLLSTVLLRIAVPAFQAACRGFEPRLPLHFPVSCSGPGGASVTATQFPNRNVCSDYGLPGQEPVKSLAR